MKNSLVLTLTFHELIHILYKHFLKKELVKEGEYSKMSFSFLPDGRYKCELFNDVETDILKPVNEKNEKNEKKVGRMIRIDESETK